MKSFDAIVIGIGGVGSAAACFLSQRGASVLALDRFPPGHDRGSSHGQTRIIRKAYFEHSDYVPLLERAYQLWQELEQRCGEQLYFPVGLIEVGPPDGVVVPNVLRSARQYQLAVESLTRDDWQARFPGFTYPEGYAAVFERDAGYLLVERCVEQYADAAVASGCQVALGSEVRAWRDTGTHIEVRTENDTFVADRLVITAGAWAASLLASCNVPLQVLRKHLHWYACQDQPYSARLGCPAFFYETPRGFFYGFPKIDARGLKVAQHDGGTPIEDPLNDLREPDPSERTLVEGFLTDCLPDISVASREHAVCYYTMSPDEHFVVDCHPQSDRVVFAAGLSGHGFKFASVLGEILADLAMRGQSSLPIEFLSVSRFAQ